jgi:hypothetical protein
MSPVSEKSRSNLEIGAVFAAFLFLITLAFNAGIQYGQIHTLQVGQDAHDAQIRALQVTNNEIGRTVTHIETLVEDMKATEELRHTGAMH